MCSGCNRFVSIEKFSKNQLRKFENQRCCICVKFDNISEFHEIDLNRMKKEINKVLNDKNQQKNRFMKLLKEKEAIIQNQEIVISQNQKQQIIINDLQNTIKANNTSLNNYSIVLSGNTLSRFVVIVVSVDSVHFVIFYSSHRAQ